MSNRQKRKKAATLAEVMIVLGVISTAMVASISIMINSLVRIKVNDIEDSANSVMIKALEAAKSPATISLSQDISAVAVNSSVFFSLDETARLQYEINDTVNTSCTSQNKYNVKTLLPDDVSSNSEICVQIEIIPRLGVNSKRIYEIVVRSFYVLPNGDVRANVIKGYRYGNV
ncbi:type II secretion system protein [Candidatus Dojkabacteria bacterium]|uniref:Type II secretion system protein n=1 Tax=Candidatus Dojkabacteria bacterium TaxID=2099670 RepID=A0A955LAM9_9BACT|nr:type II secretion system protein [Candidatus Dojkabacteria bacterium]